MISSLDPQETAGSGKGLDSLAADILRHIVGTLGHEAHAPSSYHYYQALAYSIRERLIRSWLNTQKACYDSMVKRVYYLSMEFLPGRFLMNYLVNMEIKKACSTVVDSLGLTLEELEEQ